LDLKRKGNRSEVAKKSWRNKKTRENRLAGIRRVARKTGEHSIRSWASPVSRKRRVKAIRIARIKALRGKRICRLCKGFFNPNGLNQKTCSRCLAVRPLCACGCGRRVGQIGSGGGKVIKRFVSGHNFGTTEFKNLQSERMKESWGRKDFRSKVLAARDGCSQDVWDSYSEKDKNERIRKVLKGARTRPNGQEKKLYRVLEEIAPKQFMLNVKGQVVLGGKVPDFVNVNGKKLLIEMFGDYWHSKKIKNRTKSQEEAYRRRHFAKFGFDVLVVWENELRDIYRLKEKLIQKIQ
jgi:very-short-patch-repair endonuclease